MTCLSILFYFKNFPQGLIPAAPIAFVAIQAKCLFDTLKSLQINALENGISDSALVASHESTLVQIAEAGPYRASVQAQALLNSVNGAAYTPEVVLPSGGEENLMAPPFGNTSLPDILSAAELEALPNPAQNQTIFRYRLPKNAESGQITVTDMAGRIVADFKVEGNTGSIAWDIKTIIEGVYQYSLMVGDRTVATKRLIIAH